ncbi:hypothetical protein DRW41_06920 [Neobacillus piezotolerans]|uniref:Uncharacterized protein n=1 Tax=Neobacillus piezotolerans TaxID=2259171 RepID=A0A3D8GU44_9BACI|nr:hypothetical protein [Neobacillus piezotolerans]RDU37566.1 hypothetical protein DRW41_06920 [Neobacillus piezotolerans]
MEHLNGQNELLEELKENPPKIIGGYKKQGWAVKSLDKISNDPVEKEEDGTIMAKAVLESSDLSYYPAFLHLHPKKKGQILGVYFIAESKDQYDLIPFELAKEFIDKSDGELLPFRYRTIEKVEGDEFQKNWPEFS